MVSGITIQRRQGLSQFIHILVIEYGNSPTNVIQPFFYNFLLL